MTKQNKIWLVLPFLILPRIAFADAGTPLLLFSFFHLVILNSIIGLIESKILDKYKIPNRTWLIIIANYVSMFVGIYITAPYIASIFGNDDMFWKSWHDNDQHLIGIIVGMFSSYLVTLIIEYPVFYLALKIKTQKKELLKPYIVANTVTCSTITIIYLFLSY